MNWLPTVLQVVLKYYAEMQLMQKTASKAKEIALQSSIVALGGIISLCFFLSATVMVFVDLGNQWEANNGTHFSGLMLSAIFLSIVGVLAFGICFFLSKYVTAKEKKKTEEVKEREKDSFTGQYGPLLLLGEEILKQVLEKISNQNQPAPQTAKNQSAPDHKVSE